MATAKTITAFKYRTEVIADITKHTSEFKKAEETVDKYGKTVQKVGKDTAKAFDGVAVGKKFGKDIGVSAVAELTSSFSVSTLGGLIGTAIAPGIGTTIGSAIGGGIDTALSKAAPIVLQTIDRGLELNKIIEDTRVEFTQMTGSEQEANKYLKDLLGISKDLGILPQTVIETSEQLSDLTGSLRTTNILLKAAADQAADFSGTSFEKVATDLGQIAAQSSLAEKELKKLIKSDAVVNADKYLAEATGKTEAQIKKLVAAGRIRGSEAAQIIGLGIEREKGGLAGFKTSQTVSGRERQFGVLTTLRAGEATQETMRGLGDFYERANAILDSPQAKAFTDFINNYSGKLITFTEGAIKTGVSVGAGVAEGLINFNPGSMMQSFTKLSSFVTSGLQTVFEIHSPSELSAREIGEPIGIGIGIGVVRGLNGFIQGDGGGQIVNTLRELVKDPRVDALLNTIAKAEGGGMNVMAGGRRVNSGALHPGQIIPKSQWFKGNRGPSSASGLYQETVTNWLAAEAVFGPLNFSDSNDQKLVAAWLMVSHPGGLQALKSGNVNQMTSLAAKDWTSTPGSRIGGGGQKSASWWQSTYQRFLNGGGGADLNGGASTLNAMPVYVVNSGGELSGNFGRPRSEFGGSLTGGFGQSMSLEDLPKAFVNVTGAAEALTTKTAEETMATTVQMKSLIPLIQYQERTKEETDTLTQQMKALGAEAIIGAGKLSQVAGAIGQITGMIPSQQVGKKRSIWSKILGVAAPLVSLIPGVGPILGPILSTIVGTAGNIVGGDYGAAVAKVGGGLQAGGVFRSTGSSSSGDSHSDAPSHATGLSFVPHNNYRANLHYGEGVVTAAANLNGGGGGLHGELAERLVAALERWESAPPGHIATMVARQLPDELGRNASLNRKMQLNLGMS